MNKSKVKILRARLYDQHVERINTISATTGLNISAILRQLIENAEVTPSVVNVQVYRNENDCRANKQLRV